MGLAWLTVGLVRPWGERLFGWRIPRLLPVIAGACGGLAVMVWCYLPVLLWGPLVLATVWSYWRARVAVAGKDGHR